jgi:hypothetical protein
MAIVVVFAGGIDRADVAASCDRLRMLLARAGRATVICDVSAISDPDAVVIEALARLRLTALRGGGRVELRAPAGALDDLLTFVGMHDAIAGRGSAAETSWQPEEREQVRGVEEERDAGDPIA